MIKVIKAQKRKIFISLVNVMAALKIFFMASLIKTIKSWILVYSNLFNRIQEHTL